MAYLSALAQTSHVSMGDGFCNVNTVWYSTGESYLGQLPATARFPGFRCVMVAVRSKTAPVLTGRADKANEEDVTLKPKSVDILKGSVGGRELTAELTIDLTVKMTVELTIGLAVV